MPPRKRKAPQALAAINEAEQDQPGPSKAAVPEANGVGDEQTIRSIVEECKEQVEAKVTSLIETARQKVQHLRTDAELAIIKLTKQARQTPAADFFKLGPEEAGGSSLSNVLLRLRRLQQGGDGVGPAEVEAAGLVAASLVTAAAAAAPATAPATEAQDAGPQHASTIAEPDGGSGPSTSGKAAALMPPPPPRAALAAVNSSARAPMQNEVVYSANGSPIYLNVAAAAAATATKGAPSMVDATPAVGTSYAAAPPPQTMAFTGATFLRATAARGRTKQATRAITITAADGRTFVVDDVIGLAGVPDKYREEVRKLLESDMEDLTALYKSVASIEQSNAAAAAATTATGTKRPARRR